eukprot:scaffold111358_cov60-Phaeocystis_antarctica.AAC.6
MPASTLAPRVCRAVSCLSTERARARPVALRPSALASRVDAHRELRRLAASTQACAWPRTTARPSASLALCLPSSASLCFIYGRSLCHLRRRPQLRALIHRRHHGLLGHRHPPRYPPRLCP